MPRPDLPQMPGRDIAVFVNGAAVRFDVPPQMVEGFVFVPLRGVFEKLGASVGFDAESGLVTADRASTHVELKVGSTMAKVNDETMFMLQPAQSLRGRTLVPLRFLSEALGAEVEWNPGARSVTVRTSK